MYRIFLSLLEITGETTYQVAEATGIKSNLFSEWKKRSEVDPEAALSFVNMKKIADHFKVSLDIFFRNHEKKE